MNEQEITPELIKDEIEKYYDWDKSSRYENFRHTNRGIRLGTRSLFLNDLVAAYSLDERGLKWLAAYALEESHGYGFHEAQGILENILEYIERG